MILTPKFVHNLVSLIYLLVFLDCVTSECPRPKDPANGRIVESGDVFQEGDRITYRCDPSHQADTAISSKRICRNGQWSNADYNYDEYCFLPSCNPLPSIANGKQDGYNTDAYQWVKYVCNKGYDLNGPSRGYFCKRTQDYDPDPNVERTTCTIKDCGPKPSVEHGTVRLPDKTTTYGSRLELICSTGYMIDGTTRFAKCEETGDWGALPSCTAVKCPKPDIPHGSYQGELTYPNTITFSCDSEYTLVGADKAECRASATWKPKNPPKCYGSCPTPVIANGAAETSRDTHIHGTALSFKCEIGYELNSLQKAICNDGTFIHLPKCYKKCQPENISHGYYETNDDNTITYKCQDNYWKIGHGKLKCVEGKWNHKPPHCINLWIILGPIIAVIIALIAAGFCYRCCVYPNNAVTRWENWLQREFKEIKANLRLSAFNLIKKLNRPSAAHQTLDMKQVEPAIQKVMKNFLEQEPLEIKKYDKAEALIFLNCIFALKPNKRHLCCNKVSASGYCSVAERPKGFASLRNEEKIQAYQLLYLKYALNIRSTSSIYKIQAKEDDVWLVIYTPELKLPVTMLKVIKDGNTVGLWQPLSIPLNQEVSSSPSKNQNSTPIVIDVTSFRTRAIPASGWKQTDFVEKSSSDRRGIVLAIVKGVQTGDNNDALEKANEDCLKSLRVRTISVSHDNIQVDMV